MSPTASLNSKGLLVSWVVKEWTLSHGISFHPWKFLENRGHLEEGPSTPSLSLVILAHFTQEPLVRCAACSSVTDDVTVLEGGCPCNSVPKGASGPSAS
jgi:hypothetical protein